MDTNTGQNQSNNGVDEVDQFLGQIIDEKNLTGITPEIKAHLVEDMRNRLMEQIDRAMVNALRPEQVQQLNSLLDAPNFSDDKVQAFFKDAGVDAERVALDTMMRFRQYYLGMEK